METQELNNIHIFCGIILSPVMQRKYSSFNRSFAADTTTLPFSGGKGPERAETALRKFGQRLLRIEAFKF